MCSPTPTSSDGPSSGYRCGCTRTSWSRPRCLVPGDEVLLLPVTTRYEQEGGGTETTTERRIIYSPEIPRVVGEARSEWRLFADVASRVRPDLRNRFSWPDSLALRAEIADIVPDYAGIETLSKTGDQVQYGGRHLCAGGRFPLPGGRARFSVLEPPPAPPDDGRFQVATRRGKQFNSVIWKEVDPLTGAGPRRGLHGCRRRHRAWPHGG